MDKHINEDGKLDLEKLTPPKPYTTERKQEIDELNSEIAALAREFDEMCNQTGTYEKGAHNA